jgi:hypothetical protein
MKRFLLIWFAGCLALNPVIGAFASSMPMPMKAATGSHCAGHAAPAKASQDLPMKCCKSHHDSRKCCDHCVASLSALLNTGFTLAFNEASDPAITFIKPVLSETHSPLYKPPRA